MSCFIQKRYKTSSVKLQMETSENLFGSEEIGGGSEVDTTLLFEEIRKELGEYLVGESHDTDSTDGVFDFLIRLSQKIQEEFDRLLDGDSNKKCFLTVLTRIFALLLNTNVGTPAKIGKNSIQMTIKIWSGKN